ncbi:hypothetical protein N0V84_009126 [Fusarium piperis]|uniref:DUF7924 domain-containing protein n=1 Tax=Fusarium piperis TaxID=1435070 RepID=A0A9W8W6X5_9HYPO|nr:hypothetical protein N0V84_009126 [Fusarium piperis]
MIHQPTPRRTSLTSVALLEDLAASQTSARPFERVEDWLESTYPVDREESRSDSFLQVYLEPIDPRTTQSAPPEMPPNMPPPSSYGGKKGYAATPVTSSRSSQAGPVDSPARASSVSRSGSLVENPLYRETNLAENNIYLRSSRHELPREISNLLVSVQKERGSPVPCPTTINKNYDLYAMEEEASEAQVEAFVRDHVVPSSSREDTIQRSDRIAMIKSTVPSTHPKHRLSTPVPDMLYGYNRSTGFTREQRTQISTSRNKLVANNEGLLCPFFALEFKGDGPSSNGSATCINIAEQLGKELQQCKRQEVSRLDNESFSIAMNGTEARLFVSWREDRLIHMQKVNSFILQRPEEFLEFRKWVRNIIDWGRDDRLRKIQSALDALIEEGRMAASKSRPPPAGPGPSDAVKRQRSN